MRPRHLEFVLGVFALCSSAFAQPVTRVIDGDTIVVQGVGTVRLIGVDTPETVDPRKPVQPFGREASAFTRQLVGGKVVRLEYDWQRKDKYDRTLAYVFLADGTFVNAEIVKQGFGHAYTQYSFKYLDEFRGYEREARTAGRGLWVPSTRRAPPSSQRRAPPSTSRGRAPSITAKGADIWPDHKSPFRFEKRWRDTAPAASASRRH